MPNLYLNDEEWRALFNERPELCKLYCGIKRAMDYKTAVAGISYRMSDSFFTDLMYVEAVQGRKAVRYTRGQIRKAIERLEALDMLKRVGPNVFKLLLVSAVQSDQNNRLQTGARAGRNDEPQQVPDILASNTGQTGASVETGNKPEHEQGAPNQSNRCPPLSSNNITNTIALVDKSEISENFTPSEKILQRAKLSGVPESVNIDDEVIKFISHNKALRTQAAAQDWQWMFLKWLMNAKVYQQTNIARFEKKNSYKKSTKPLSFQQGIEALANELGLPSKPGESYDQWNRRLQIEQKKRKA